MFAVLFFAIVSLRDRSLQAQRSQQVIAAASELQTLVVDMQTGVRGFIIFNKPRYLEPWRTARRRYPRARTTFLQLTRATRSCAGAPCRSRIWRTSTPSMSRQN